MGFKVVERGVATDEGGFSILVPAEGDGYHTPVLVIWSGKGGDQRVLAATCATMFNLVVGARIPEGSEVSVSGRIHDVKPYIERMKKARSVDEFGDAFNSLLDAMEKDDREMSAFSTRILISGFLFSRAAEEILRALSQKGRS